MKLCSWRIFDYCHLRQFALCVGGNESMRLTNGCKRGFEQLQLSRLGTRGNLLKTRLSERHTLSTRLVQR